LKYISNVSYALETPLYSTTVWRIFYRHKVSQFQSSLIDYFECLRIPYGWSYEKVSVYLYMQSIWSYTKSKSNLFISEI